jgi:S1-C subfamily serine protease
MEVARVDPSGIDAGAIGFRLAPRINAAGRLHRADAGLELLLTADLQRAESVQQLRNAIAAMSPNSDVNMEVWRKKKLETVTIKLGEQPEDLMAARTTKPTPSNESPTSLDALGVSVATLNSELAEKYQLEVQKGALITKVERNSPAWREGLRMGDVITEVGEHAINSAEDLTEAMKKQDIKKGVRLYVTGRDGSRFVFLSS